MKTTKVDWWDNLALWCGATVALIMVTALLWYAGVATYAVASLVWRPLVQLALVWLIVGNAGAAVICPLASCRPFWQLWLRIRDEIDTQADRLRVESKYRLNPEQARVLAGHEFWYEWRCMVGWLPAAIIGGVVMTVVIALIGDVPSHDPDGECMMEAA